MKRREAVLAAGTTVLFAGCTGSGGENESETEQPTESTSNLEPADLRVDSLEVQPQKVEITEPFTLVIDVSNHGGQPGQGEVWYTVEDSEGVREQGSSLVDLDGGESDTLREEFSFPAVGEYTAAVNPDRTRGVRGRDFSSPLAVMPREITYGTTFENAEGYSLNVGEMQLQDSYEARSNLTGETETVKPETHDLFAFVRVSIGNDGNATGVAPSPNNFFARVDGTAYELGIDPGLRRPDFRGDLEGIELYDAGEVPAGSERSGYLVFEVPKSARESFETGWSSRYSPDQVVYWG